MIKYAVQQLGFRRELCIGKEKCDMKKGYADAEQGISFRKEFCNYDEYAEVIRSYVEPEYVSQYLDENKPFQWFEDESLICTDSAYGEAQQCTFHVPDEHALYDSLDILFLLDMDCENAVMRCSYLMHLTNEYARYQSYQASSNQYHMTFQNYDAYMKTLHENIKAEFIGIYADEERIFELFRGDNFSEEIKSGDIGHLNAFIHVTSEHAVKGVCELEFIFFIRDDSSEIVVRFNDIKH